MGRNSLSRQSPRWSSLGTLTSRCFGKDPCASWEAGTTVRMIKPFWAAVRDMEWRKGSGCLCLPWRSNVALWWPWFGRKGCMCWEAIPASARDQESFSFGTGVTHNGKLPRQSWIEASKVLLWFQQPPIKLLFSGEIQTQASLTQSHPSTYSPWLHLPILNLNINVCFISPSPWMRKLFYLEVILHSQLRNMILDYGSQEKNRVKD